MLYASLGVLCNLALIITGGEGTRAQENRGRERKGQDMGVLRGWEVGEKCKMLFILIQQCVRILLKTRTQNIFDLHLTSSQSLLRLLIKGANENYFWSNSKPIYSTGSYWEAVRNNFIKNKENFSSKDYELYGRCAVLLIIV